jgi:hypothetical protein
VSWAVVSAVTSDCNVDMEDIVNDSKILSAYHEFLSVVEQCARDSLRPHCWFDHAIELKNAEVLPQRLIYALSEPELTMLRKFLGELLHTMKSGSSKLPTGTPMLFVPNAHGRDLYLCVDYRRLNRVTVLNRYPLSLMNKLRTRVQASTIFTSINLKSGYNLVRINEVDEWKTVFRTYYGHFEYLVMLFVLANTLATF